MGTLCPKFAMYLDKRQSGGVTRLCRPPLESVARAAATIMPPFRASYVKSPEGYETLYVTMLYILTDEDGEFHAPKKRSDGIEVALSAALKTRLRVQVLDDIQFLSTRCAPLSPKYWLQLGNPQRAAEIQQGGPAALLTPEQGTEAAIKWDVDCILDERPSSGLTKRWVLVRWAGYQPSWEAWRIHGDVGSPVETWEPRRRVMRTAAWRSWTTSLALETS